MREEGGDADGRGNRGKTRERREGSGWKGVGEGLDCNWCVDGIP